MEKKGRKEVNILSFDGGGTKGVMEATVVQFAMSAFTRILHDAQSLTGVLDFSISLDSRVSITPAQRFAFVELIDEEKNSSSSSSSSPFSTNPSPPPTNHLTPPPSIHPSAMFDMIVGTSTGSLIAMLLVAGEEDEKGNRTRMSMKELRTKFKRAGNIIFGSSIWSSYSPIRLLTKMPYTPIPMLEYLTDLFGGASLSQISQDCIAGCVCKRMGSDEKLEFISSISIEHRDCSIAKVCTASCNAPIVFHNPINIKGYDYVDGGIGGNCPLAQAIPTALHVFGKNVHLNIVSIAPPEPEADPLPDSVTKQILFWLGYFPNQVTNGSSIFRAVQREYTQNKKKEAQFIRVYPRGEGVSGFEMDDLRIDEMVQATKESFYKTEGLYDVLEIALTLVSSYFLNKRRQRQVQIQTSKVYEITQSLYDFMLKSTTALGSHFYSIYFDIFPEDAEAILRRREVIQKAQRFVSAGADFLRAVEQTAPKIDRNIDKEIPLLVDLGKMQMMECKYIKAFNTFEFATKILLREENFSVGKKFMVDVCVKSAECLIAEGEYDSANEKLRMAEEKFSEQHDDFEEASYNIHLLYGIINMFTGNYGKALEYMLNEKELLPLNGDVRFTIRKSKIFYHIAFCYLKQHAINEAVENLEYVTASLQEHIHAITTFESLLKRYKEEKIDGKVTNTKFFVANCKNILNDFQNHNLSSIYYISRGLKNLLEKKWLDALQDLEKSLVENRKLFNELPNLQLAQILSFLGFVSIQMGRYFQSVSYLRQAYYTIKHVDEDETHPIIGSIFTMLGLASLCIGEFQEARFILEDAVTQFEQLYTEKYENHPQILGAKQNFLLLNLVEHENSNKDEEFVAEFVELRKKCDSSEGTSFLLDDVIDYNMEICKTHLDSEIKRSPTLDSHLMIIEIPMKKEKNPMGIIMF